MRVMRSVCGVFAALAIVCVASGQDNAKNRDEAVKQEKKNLTAVWKLVSSETKGEKVPERILKGEVVRWTITDSTIAVTVEKESKGEDKYRLDPTASPKTIELKDKDGHRTPGIYSLDGDTLKVCIDEGSEERPKVFASKPDTQLSVLTFKRVRR
jgi:uncharacterized protein (TIGR03067 family)